MTPVLTGLEAPLPRASNHRCRLPEDARLLGDSAGPVHAVARRVRQDLAAAMERLEREHRTAEELMLMPATVAGAGLRAVMHEVAAS
jgi:hypothetical protein